MDMSILASSVIHQNFAVIQIALSKQKIPFAEYHLVVVIWMIIALAQTKHALVSLHF
jgi:hypothetical protein